MIRLIKSMVISAVVVGLVSCGGGGGGNDVSGTDAAPSATTAINVLFDQSVPSATRSSVAEVLTPTDAQPPGSAVAIPVGGDEFGPVVMAVDTQDRLILAGFASDSSVTLSARSTALVLTRLILGKSGFWASLEEAERSASQSAKFGRLVVAIQSALDSARAADEDEAVMTALSAVVAERIETTRAPASAASVSARARAMAVASPSVSHPLPAVVLDDSFLGVPLKITVVSANSSGSINVSNATPIFWAISSQDANGTLLPAHSADPSTVVEGKVIIPGVGLKNSIIETVVNHWLLSQLVDLLNLGGERAEVSGSPAMGFDLVVEQNDESWHRNVVAVAFDIWNHVLGQIPTNTDCIKAGLNVVNTERLERAARSESVAGIKAALKDEWLNVSTIALACPNNPKISRYIGVFTRKVSSLLVVLDTASAIEQGLTVVARMKMLEKYSDTRKVFGFCQGKNGYGDYTLIDCPAQIAFKRPVDVATGSAIEAPALIIGASLTMMIEMKDAKGQNLTDISSSLQFQNSREDVLSHSVDASMRPTVTAKKLGVSYLTVKDVATDKTDVIPFYVVKPSLVASKSTLSVGDTSEVRLVDPLGMRNTVFSEGVPISWSSSDPSKLAISPFGYQTAITVRALANTVEPVLLKATLSNGEILGQISINITSNIDYNDFRFEFSDVKASSGPTCGSVLGGHPTNWSSLFADYDHCIQYVEPTVRCVGKGCIPGRFFVSTTGFSTSIARQEVPYSGSTGPSCAGVVDEYYDTINQHGGSLTYPGTGWYSVSTYASAIYPTGTYNSYLSGFSFYYVKNVDNINFIPQHNPPYPHVCVITGYTWSISGKIYDDHFHGYRDFTFSLHLP